MKKYLFVCTTLLISSVVAIGQRSYWQQQVDYTIEVELNTENHRYRGKEIVVYSNNSPDTLTKVYFHLYNNAFQPGSMMDVRARNIEDPDRRIGDRISKLSEDEYGWLHVSNLKMDGKKQDFSEEETILVVRLTKPILPGKSVTFTLDFEAQAPLQIRRSGRDSKEGIDYSMAQWYPKMAEYDFMGWHANPYIDREFHGVWGDFDVKITLPAEYIVGATGYLQNANEIGHGYQDEGIEVKHKAGTKLTWHFVAPTVIDFVWAADPDYVHEKIETDSGTTLHFLYQDDSLTQNWKALPIVTARALEYINDNFGKYPYKQYSVIQGGDGGMEYPMATLITGNRNFKSLVAVTVHELLHSWYQMMLATNESLYSWMDEGFTSFADDEVYKYIFHPDSNYLAQKRSYLSYFGLAKSGKEEPMTTHADHYHTRFASGRAAYSKGAVYLKQLEYIIGPKRFREGMLDYFDQWKFKHPTPNDFLRVMEKVADMELRWYNELWIGTTKTIDYGVGHVVEQDGATYVTVTNFDQGIMPSEVEVTFTNGERMTYYIPLRIMRGEKTFPSEKKVITLPDWPWTYPNYTFRIDSESKRIESIALNPEGLVADINPDNDYIEIKKYAEATFRP